MKQVSAGRYDREIDPEEVKRILAAEIAKVLKPVEVPFDFGRFELVVEPIPTSEPTSDAGHAPA